MPSFFEIAILKLQQLGFFTFLLPFILTAAIIYGALRRSQIFGEPEKNIAVNSVVAFVVSLFVWASPIILGIEIETRLSSFFFQGFAVTITVLIGLMLAGMFFEPDLAKNLSSKINAGWVWGVILIIALLVGLVILVSSGLATIMFPRGIGLNISSDIIITTVALILTGVIVAFIARAR